MPNPNNALETFLRHMRDVIGSAEGCEEGPSRQTMAEVRSAAINFYNQALTDRIGEIKGSGRVFVFGSNRQGRHGAGAAKFARENYGAEQGIGEGFTGRS